MQENFSQIKGMVNNKIILISSILALLIIAGGGYYTWQIKLNNTLLQSKVKELELTLDNANESLSQIQNQTISLSGALATAEQKRLSDASKLEEAGYKVDTLQRLTKMDPQLLYKYSKIFFLNENYSPSALTPIDTKYLYNKDKPLQIHDSVWPLLKNLFTNAEQDGINLQIISAFRSFDTQAILKSSYKITYGKGTANAFSADQGYSEHQLGTTIDFTTPIVGATFTGFEKTKESTWLLNNAYKYGFILSYPAQNEFYVYEPWHWRFVGLDLALLLHNTQKNFYDLDQREINNYLVNIFSNTLAKPTSN